MSTSAAVFLSYASQDAEAVRRIAEALRAADVEVWFDQNELVGGDAWDAKIRGQIASCALFVPVISAATQERREGYFRLEWKLAAQRTHMMSERTAFLLPVVIDATRDAEADVPGEFRAVQWTRLPGGEGPAVERFCARVGKLLGAETVGSIADRAVASEQGSRLVRAQDDGSGRATPLRKAARAWWVPAAIGVAAAVAPALWKSWRAKESPPPAAPAPLSEARKLAAKAEALGDQQQLTSRADIVVGEQYCKQALALDPNDAEIWALYSRMCVTFFAQGYDRSDERRALAGRAADQAVRLAPDSPDSRYARANFYRLQANSQAAKDESRRLLRELADKHPSNKRFWRSLGVDIINSVIAGRGSDTLEEGLACLEHAIALPGGDLIALDHKARLLGNLGRVEEALAAIDQVLAARPNGASFILKVRLLLLGRGDVAQARETLAQVPVDWLHEDFGLIWASQVWLFGRDAEKCLDALRSVPRDFLESAYYYGPKALLAGVAHRMGRREEAAQIEWRSALQLVERRLASDLSNLALLQTKALLLAYLGERTEAERILRTAEQLAGATSGQPTDDTVLIYLELGKRDEVLAWLPAELQKPWNNTRPVTRATLRLDLRWDPLRGDPRFQALIDAAPGPEEKLPGKSATTATPPDPKAVAVLPFANLSGDKEQEYFSDGLTEEILNALARERDLRVPGRTSSFSFKGRNASAVEIAAALNVSRLVEGSVQRAGSKVRIRVSLTRVADNASEELGTFTEELSDIFALQDKVASAVVAKLTNRSTTARAGARREVKPEAYGLYLQARAAWVLRTDEGFRQAEQLLARVLELQPDYAPAMALLSINYSQEKRAGTSEPAMLAAQWADRALATDANLADAYAAKALTVADAGDMAGAIRLLRRSVELDPGFASGHQWLGRQLSASGDIEGSLAELRLAAQLDPLAPRILDNYAAVLAWAGRPAEALAVIDRVLAAQPDWQQGLQFRARFLAMLGRLPEALALYRDRGIDRRDPMWAARVLIAAGRRPEAEQLLAGRAPGATTGYLLCVLGRPKEGLAMMRPQTSLGREMILWEQSDVMPRDLPEFQTALKEWGMWEAWQRAEAWRAAHPPEKLK